MNWGGEWDRGFREICRESVYYTLFERVLALRRRSVILPRITHREKSRDHCDVAL